MRALIFTGGKYEDPAFYKEFSGDLFIAADSGLDFMNKISVKPDIVIGDMDSVKGLDSYDGKKLEHHSDKDETDTELAINYAIEKGADEILIFGGLASEFDHAHANLRLLLREADIKLIDEKHEIMVVRGKQEIDGKKGDVVSLFAFPYAKGVTTSGLKFPIENKEIHFTEVMNARNIMKEDKALISIEDGCLLLFHLKS